MTHIVLSQLQKSPALKFALFLIVFGIATGASAQNFTARAPEDFVRDSGQPTVVTRPFTVTVPSANYTLVIYNGGSNNQYDRVSSGIVTLNGAQVVGPSDFNQQVSIIQKPV